MANTYPKVVLTLSDSSTITWEDTDIIEAKLVEEMDPISASLPISVLNLKIFDAEDSFSVFDENESLAERQRIDLFEIINGTEYFLGRFYLDEWENVDQQTLELRAVDIIGVMDTTPFDGWFWPSGDLLTDILDSIFVNIPETYVLSTELDNENVYGYIPNGSVRDALQQVCFAIGAAVITSRRSQVELTRAKVPSAEGWQSLSIGVDDKFRVQPTKLLPIVTEIELMSHEYSMGDEQDLYTGIFHKGIDYKIYWNVAPALTPRTREAIWPIQFIKESYTYLEFRLGTFANDPEELTFYGNVYDDSKQSFTFVESNLPAITKVVKLTVDNATMVNQSNVQQVLARLRDYYRHRYIHTFKPVVQDGITYNTQVYGDAKYGWSTFNIQIGLLVKIGTLQGSLMRSLIRKATIDLTGGFLAEFEAIGVKIQE
jgi:hypothetical protein